MSQKTRKSQTICKDGNGTMATPACLTPAADDLCKCTPDVLCNESKEAPSFSFLYFAVSMLSGDVFMHELALSLCCE